MHKYSKQQVEANALIDKLGGNDAVAHKLGISAPAISWWRKNGIPALRMVQLELVYGKDKLKV